MAALAIGAAAVGALAGAAGSIMQGNAAAANALADAKAHYFNAKVAEQQARNTQEGALADANDYRRLQSSRLAARRAQMGGAGVVASEGSPLLVDESILSNIEFGATRIINEGDIKSVRLRNEATLKRAQARASRRGATYARQAGYIGAVSTLASGTTNTLLTAKAFS